MTFSPTSHSLVGIFTPIVEGLVSYMLEFKPSFPEFDTKC